ncbi:MAG: discoidin domain-containing protein [Fibrobacterota bacterium]
MIKAFPVIVFIFLTFPDVFCDTLFGGERLYIKIGTDSGFVIQPPVPAEDGSKPCVWFAPTFIGTGNDYPASCNAWYLSRLIQQGFWVCGVDVGESYGSPRGRKLFNDMYDSLMARYQLDPKMVLMAQSRGGLMLYNWAADSGNSEKVSRIAGIYPVGDLRSYPGLGTAAPAYGMATQQLSDSLSSHNPIDRLKPLFDAGVKILHIHGDVDGLVPLAQNSQVIYDRYTAMGGDMRLIVVPGYGHTEAAVFFQDPRVLDFMLGKPDTTTPPDTTPVDSLLDYASYTNVALASHGATASASSQYSLSFPAAGVINGNRTSSDWGMGGGWNDATLSVWPDWIEIDFGSPSDIREIDVFSYGGGSVEPTLTALGGELSAFDVQYWNDTIWTAVPNGNVSGSAFLWNRISLPSGITTSKIKVIVNQGSQGDYTRMMEVEAWSPATTKAQQSMLNVPVPGCFELTRVVPNPFSGAARIQFGVPTGQKREMSLQIYDIEGRLVQTLVKGSLQPGHHAAMLNGRGRVNGVYFCRMRAPGFEKSIKLLLCK